MVTFITADGQTIDTDKEDNSPEIVTPDAITHDTLFQDRELINSARRFYWNRDKKSFAVGEEGDKEAAAYFISDQRWKDSNTVSALKRLNYVRGGFGQGASETDLEDLNLMLDRWERLPGAFSRIADGDIKGGLGAIAANVGRGILDPTIFAGGIVGKGVAKGVSEGAKRAVQVGTAVSVDAAVTGGFNYTQQKIAVEAGLKEEVSPWEAIVVGAIGGLVSAPSAVFQSANKVFTPNPLDAVERSIRTEKDLRGKISGEVGESLLPGTKVKVSDAAKQIQEESAEAAVAAAEKQDFNPFSGFGNELFEQQLVREPKGVMNSIGALVDDFDPSLKSLNPKIYQQTIKSMGELQNRLLSDTSLRGMNQQELMGLVRGELKDLFEYMRRGTVDDNSLVKNAQHILKDMGMDAETATLGRNVGDAVLAEHAIIAKMAETSLWENVSKIGLKISMETDPAKASGLADLQQDVLHRAMVTTLQKSAMFSEGGRLLRQARGDLGTIEGLISATGKQLDKNIQKMFNTTRTLSAEEKVNLSKDLTQAIGMLDPNNRLQHELFVKNMAAHSLGDMFWETWYNALLSSPATMGINITGNFGTLLLDDTERLLAGSTRSIFKQDGEMLREAVGQIYGQISALPDAFRVAAQTFKRELPFDPKTRMEGQNTSALPSIKWNPNRTGILDAFVIAGKGEGGIGGNQVRIPGRILMATDDFFKIIHTRGYMYSQGIKEAKEKGATSFKEVRKYMNDDFLPKVPERHQMVREAVEHGRRLTFTEDPGRVGNAISILADEIPGGRLILPFVRTPANILRFASERIPGIHMMTRTGADIKAGGEAATLANSRLALGGLTVATGALMAFDDKVIGGKPSDPAMRNSFDSAGLLPWSIKIGDQWIQWNRADPVAIPFALGAGMKELAMAGMDPNDQTAMYEVAATLFADALLDKSWFQGVENVVNAITDPGRFGHSLGMSLARTAVPSVVAGATRALNPVTTAPMSFEEAIQDRLRFDRGEVPGKVNAFGFEGEFEVAGTGKGKRGVLSTINRFVSPFRASTTREDDPVIQEVLDLEVGISKPQKTMFGIKLDSRQYYAFSKAKGQQFYNISKWMVNSPAWGNMNKAMKRRMFDYANLRAGEHARLVLLGTYPELISAQLMDKKAVKMFTQPTRTEKEEQLERALPKLLGREESGKWFSGG